MSTVRVFILDDHEVVRTGLRQLVDRAEGLELVGEAATAAEAIAQIPERRPDVAIIDARLSDGSGIDVCRQVRSLDPRIKALILTSYDDDDAVLAAVLAGAAGYVLKDIRNHDLVARVRAVAAGRSVIDPETIAHARSRLRRGQGVDARGAPLTAEEWRVLHLISDGLTNPQIGEELALSEKTVTKHVSNVLAKLGTERWAQGPLLGLDPTTSGS